MREQKVMKLVKKLGEKVVAGSVNSASSKNIEKILKK